MVSVVEFLMATCVWCTAGHFPALPGLCSYLPLPVPCSYLPLPIPFIISGCMCMLLPVILRFITVLLHSIVRPHLFHHRYDNVCIVKVNNATESSLPAICQLTVAF